jgi:hypothetical protein
MLQRLGSLALSVGLVVVSAVGALAGVFWGFGLRCDDSCGTPPPWRDDPDAWQWEALGWVALGGFAFALVFLTLVAARLRAAAFAALAGWATLAGVYLDLLRDSGLMSRVEEGWLALSALVVAGVVAMVLTPSRR